MEPDADAEMNQDTGLRVPAVSVISGLAASPLPPRPAFAAFALKVTFHPLDIFLRRSKLPSIATPAATPAKTAGVPGFFLRIIFP